MTMCTHIEYTLKLKSTADNVDMQVPHLNYHRQYESPVDFPCGVDIY